ncbi:hypothetical protein VE02_04667 [Pseudogymnoascus sp. 03VT05]|nr:hypothetical protein VE02_04667 [Pseudogymnoascus sp. 03VT05]
MSGSPKLQAPATPTPSGVASSTLRSCTVCLYHLPLVEDKVKDVVAPKPKALKDERTMLRWKVATCCVVPKSARRLRASSSQRRYSNAVMGKEAGKKKRATAAAPSVAAPSVARPSIARPSVARKVIVRNIDDPRQALLHYTKTLIELGKAKTKALKAATAAFHAATNAALDAY